MKVMKNSYIFRKGVALQLQYYSFEKPKTGRFLWLYLICPIPTITR